MSEVADVVVWRRAAIPLIWSRVLMVAGVLFALWFGGGLDGYPSIVSLIDHIFYSWDGQSYVAIAQSGYSTVPDPRFIPALLDHGYSLRLNHLDAFLPGYPLLIRFTSPLVGGDLVLAGVVVSVVAEAVALYYIYRLIAHERDTHAAAFATWGTALAPMAFFFGAVYTESTFMAAAAASLYYMRNGRFAAASLAAAVGCATRITGIALLVALLIEYIRQRGVRPRPGVLWLAVAPLPLVAFAAYMQWRTGDALAMLHANTAYYTHYLDWPWNGLVRTWNTMNGANAFTFFREIVFGVLGILACVAAWVWPRFPRSIAAYCTVVVLTSIAIDFWLSVPRYELALFPMAMLFTDWLGRRREILWALVGASSMLMVWGTVIYVQGGWLA